MQMCAYTYIYECACVCVRLWVSSKPTLRNIQWGAISGPCRRGRQSARDMPPMNCLSEQWKRAYWGPLETRGNMRRLSSRGQDIPPGTEGRLATFPVLSA